MLRQQPTIRVVRAPAANPEHFQRPVPRAYVDLNVNSPATALQRNARGDFAYRGVGYRYILTADHFKLKLQCKREVLERFRVSRIGRKAMELVTVADQGYGWYEVTSLDFSNLVEIDGIPRNALLIWVRIFNQFTSNPVEVHVVADAETKVETPPAYVDPEVLAERDAHVMKFQVRIHVKRDPIQVDNARVISRPAKAVVSTKDGTLPLKSLASPDKLQALAARWKKH